MKTSKLDRHNTPVWSVRYEKTKCLLVCLAYLFGGFYVSRTNVPVLDDLTDWIAGAYDRHKSSVETTVSSVNVNRFVEKPFAEPLGPIKESDKFFESLKGTTTFKGPVKTFYDYLMFANLYVFSLPRKILKTSVEFLSNFSLFWLATIGTIIYHQLVYWILSAPSFCYDFMPSMRPYKIQKNKTVSNELRKDCFKRVFFSQWVIEAPFYLGNYYFCLKMNYGTSYETFPKWYQLIGALIGCLAIEDTWHFFTHWLMHSNTFLYTNVHKLHHRFVTPTGMQAEYAHPAEILTLGLGFTLGCAIYCTHFFATWIWMFVRLLESIEVHSGYNVPLFNNLTRFLPYYGGPCFHDFHHSDFLGNYSSTFTYWDRLFGTDEKFRRTKKICQKVQ